MQGASLFILRAAAEQDILMQDRRFAGLQKQIWEQMKKLETSGMDMQQSLAVEGLIS